MAQTDILEYLRKTPHNTNVNVVKTMLNAEGSGSDGGAEPLIVNFESYEDETTCDHTLAEITAAFNSGRAVYATALDSDGSLLPLILLSESGAVFELVRYSQTDTHGFVSFDSLTFEVDGEEVLVYASSNSGTFVLSNA